MITLKGFRFKKVDEAEWEMVKDYQGERLKFFCQEKLLRQMEETVFLQAKNVVQLPGLAGPVCLMPDAHSGYGAPIGTVFAMDKVNGFVSPGAIGYDINCGMRLITTNLFFKELEPFIEKLVDGLFANIPVGAGGKGFLKINQKELKKLTEEGVPYLVNHLGIGWPKDIERIEEKGVIGNADFSCVSQRAKERGLDQLATLGSGNHYLEIQRVEKIFDQKEAKKLGILTKNQITIMIHCGSRGFGHQVCTDYLKIFSQQAKDYKIEVRDRQLIYAPIQSKIAKNYLAAMAASANYAFVNRQSITHKTRQVFEKVLGRSAADLKMDLVYDVAHNIGKFEGKYFVHRKGATRSYPDTPVIIGGSMEVGSYLLIGTEQALKKSYGSTAHGSGRTMSRTKAKKIVKVKKLWQEMKNKGIYVRSASLSGLAEEAGLAYKNITDVVKSVELAGLSKPVAYLRPIGNIKG